MRASHTWQAVRGAAVSASHTWHCKRGCRCDLGGSACCVPHAGGVGLGPFQRRLVLRLEELLIARQTGRKRIGRAVLRSALRHGILNDKLTKWQLTMMWMTWFHGIHCMPVSMQ